MLIDLKGNSRSNVYSIQIYLYIRIYKYIYLWSHPHWSLILNKYSLVSCVYHVILGNSLFFSCQSYQMYQ